jgi:hypothetical protein
MPPARSTPCCSAPNDRSRVARRLEQTTRTNCGDRASTAKLVVRVRFGIVTIRITALFVLLASFSDYWAYDRYDPTAPMNASGSEGSAALDLHAPSGIALHSANLPDDDCVCCSPLIASAAPVLPQPALGMRSPNELAYPAGASELKPPAISTSPPSLEPTRFERPRRV